jgi:hypothetical protein
MGAKLGSEPEQPIHEYGRQDWKAQQDLKDQPHLHIDGVVIGPHAILVAFQQTRGAQGFHVLMHPPIIAAERLCQGTDVPGRALVDMPQ